MKIGFLAFTIFTVAFGFAITRFVMPQDMGFAWVTPRVHNRFPANLQPQNWDLAPKKMQLERNFFRSLKINSTGSTTLIELEQFATMDTDGQLNMSCLVYDQLHFTFLADGEAISGEKPKLEISTECVPKAGLATAMAPVLLPINEIQKTEAKDGVLKFVTNLKSSETKMEESIVATTNDALDTNEKLNPRQLAGETPRTRAIEMKVSNVHGRWPRSWFLSEVRFEQTSTNKQKKFIVNEMLSDVASGELKAPYMIW